MGGNDPLVRKKVFLLFFLPGSPRFPGYAMVFLLVFFSWGSEANQRWGAPRFLNKVLIDRLNPSGSYPLAVV
jgi:hypothetical protein